MENRRFTLLEFSGLALFLLGVTLSLAVGKAMERPPSMALARIWMPDGGAAPRPICASFARAPPASARAFETLDQLHLYSTEAAQLGTSLLLFVTAGIGLAAAVIVFGSVVRDWHTNERKESRGVGIWLLAVTGVGLTLGYVVHAARAPSMGFLSQLLTTLDRFPTCGQFRRDVETARLVGEGTAFLMATAMTASAIVITPTADRIAVRVQLLQRLLYAASLLFVAGILMSHANFSLVLANWVGQSTDDKLAKALQDVVSSGGVQSGVAYSALVAIFYLPTRFYLAVLTDRLISAPSAGRSAARAQLLKDNGVPVSWWEDAKQILALLAPVLASPIFDAIAKTK